MTEERVRELLNGYRRNRARARHLEAEIIRLNTEYERTRIDLLDVMASPGAQVISDMPRASGGVNDKVGRIAQRLADGVEPEELKEIRGRIDSARKELEDIRVECLYVQGWVECLPERERFIVERKVFDGLFWRDMVDEYLERYKVELSIDSLKRLKRAALKRIYRVAR